MVSSFDEPLLPKKEALEGLTNLEHDCAYLWLYSNRVLKTRSEACWSCFLYLVCETSGVIVSEAVRQFLTLSPS